MFENIAKLWLDKWFEDCPNEVIEDLVFTFNQIFEAGYSEGYDKGLEENLTELQW